MTTPARHWHVRLSLTGERVEPRLLRAAIERLSEQRAYLESWTATEDFAELDYWDEGESMLDVASLAMRLWNEHRESAQLPAWEVVGLEIVERSIHDERSR